MGLNIKNRGVEQLAAEVARLAGESKTEAIRRALEARRSRLALGRTRPSRADRMRFFLERRVWPDVPASVSRRRLTKREEERILGYGSGGA